MAAARRTPNGAQPVAAHWHREEQADAAADKILDAAAKAFVERGVSASGMGEIASFAGCSRATLYRYFPNRHALHLAFIDRTAERLAERVARRIASIDDPEERLIEGILRSVREVRSTPETAAWFTPGESGVTARMSRGSEVVEHLAATFVARMMRSGRDDAASVRRARFLVRVILSLLTMPEESDRAERELVTRFVAPSLMRDLTS